MNECGAALAPLSPAWGKHEPATSGALWLWPPFSFWPGHERDKRLSLGTAEKLHDTSMNGINAVLALPVEVRLQARLSLAAAGARAGEWRWAQMSPAVMRCVQWTGRDWSLH